MGHILRSSRAEEDLLGIWLIIARESETAADRLIEMIEQRFQTLLQFPLGGEACPQFGEGMRWFPAGNYVIFYRPADDGIQIARVIHGSRDLDQAF